MVYTLTNEQLITKVSIMLRDSKVLERKWRLKSIQQRSRYPELWSPMWVKLNLIASFVRSSLTSKCWYLLNS